MSRYGLGVNTFYKRGFMKKGFTIIEVSILFVIFLIVAFLVAPLSLDDTMQAKHTSRWKNVQGDFTNIFYSINTQKENTNHSFRDAFEAIITGETKDSIKPYKITFKNGAYPNATYRFKDFYTTYSKAVMSVKMFESNDNGVEGILLYDVNGTTGPNSWGKDVFGLNIYNDRFEPFCKNESLSYQKQDCSRNGTGLCCSNYYLIGGNFD